MPRTIKELLQSEFVQNINGEAIVAFTGAMSQDSIVGLGEVIRSELHQYHPLNVVNKVFAIYVEMTQNILHYSLQKADHNGKETGKGSVLVLTIAGGYSIVGVNTVSEEQKGFLEKKFETINSFNEDEIKDHYLKRRRHLAEGNSKGAGLGFIDMVRRSGKPLDFFFEPENNQEYSFYLSSKILIE